MFGHDHFYHAAVRKQLNMFASMFNDISIQRKNKANKTIQNIVVPINYGPKAKWLARLRDGFIDPSTKKVAVTLPRLSFEMGNISYDPARTTNRLNISTNTHTSDRFLKAQRTPIPYNIDVSLFGYFKSSEDALQVLEQINPFFRPDWTQSVKLSEEMDRYHDVSTTLNDFSIEDNYEADFTSRRELIYTWNFTIKGYLFGPVETKGVIKRAIVDAGLNDDPTGPGLRNRTTLTAGASAEAFETNIEDIFEEE